METVNGGTRSVAACSSSTRREWNAVHTVFLLVNVQQMTVGKKDNRPWFVAPWLDPHHGQFQAIIAKAVNVLWGEMNSNNLLSSIFQHKYTTDVNHNQIHRLQNAAN